MDRLPLPPVLISVSRFVGIFATTLYAGFSAADSFLFIPPLIEHASNERTMAKQWYQGYKLGPYWVPTFVAPATFSNLYLALTVRDPLQRSLYLLAAAGIFSILPITFLYMEPGVNGASKWRLESLLRDEGVKMPETSIWWPSTLRHGSTQASRRWAEDTNMETLILFWRKVNNFRWTVAGIAACLSGAATFGWL